jgi:ribosomal subunit interface protein
MIETTFFGRQTNITERFKETANKKLDRFSSFSDDVQKIKVELHHMNNPRLAEVSEKVELTVTAKNSLIRAEASAADPYAALDLAVDKLAERIRRDVDRRKSHARNAGTSKTVFVHPHYKVSKERDREADEIESLLDGDTKEPNPENGEFTLGTSPVVIRKKVHKDVPMSLEDAIYNMEMIDHDFYVYVDINSKRPAVVYRRNGYSYGVLELEDE